MKSKGAVNLVTATSTTTKGVIVNEGTLNVAEGVVFYSDNESDGMLLNLGTGPNGVTGPSDVSKIILRKTFDGGKWYPISFPFDVDVDEITLLSGEV
ncbi:MAG: hypothetical protein LBH12_06195, partial [Dysgonamonadaceae bacterium]|nr:hypothetical protein [Dysgonamonadaceae bacterium]